jgi:putative ABC transport system permease protein
MSWTHWIMKNLLRNRMRTVLTVASVGVSMFLLVLFSAGYHFLTAPDEGHDQSHLILVVSPRVSFSTLLPLSYGDRIRALPGVAVMSPFMYVAAHYGSDNDLIPALATRQGTIFQFFSNWQVSGQEEKDYISEKSAAVVGEGLAKKYGWRLGDRIQLQGAGLMPIRLDLVVRGIYNADHDTNVLAFHWSYWNDLEGTGNKTLQFWVVAKSPADTTRLVKRIDREFRNAPVATTTQTLKQELLDFLRLLGNVKLVLIAVSGAIVFAVLLVMANTMAMTIRERTREIAVLRALGFRQAQVLRLLGAESALLALMGALLGCGAAMAATRLLSSMTVGGAMPARLKIDFLTVLMTLLVALVIALASTVLPARRAVRVNLSRALRFAG